MELEQDSSLGSLNPDSSRITTTNNSFSVASVGRSKKLQKEDRELEFRTSMRSIYRNGMQYESSRFFLTNFSMIEVVSLKDKMM